MKQVYRVSFEFNNEYMETPPYAPTKYVIAESFADAERQAAYFIETENNELHVDEIGLQGPVLGGAK
jgi:hypothetical protein